MVMKPQDETQFKVDILIISFHVNFDAQYYLKSLAQQESPVNVVTKHQTYWRRDPRTSQMASSSPMCSAPKTSWGNHLLMVNTCCTLEDFVRMLIASPPYKKKESEEYSSAPSKNALYHIRKKKLCILIYIYNIPSIIFEGPHFEFAGSVFWSKKNLDSLQSSPHPPRKWLFAGCFTRTTMSADGSTMFC